MSASSQRFRQRAALLALAAASIATTLAVFEVSLRWLGYEPIYAVYSHPEIFWQKDPHLGWAHTPNAEGVYVGPRPWPIEYEAPVRINSLGLRGPEVTDLPEAGYRIMVLGDSMVAGFEVPWEQSFIALLEVELNREFDFPVQVINAGVRGYGTDQSYLYYKERGSRLDPDLVIFIHGGNDAADNVTLHRMRRIYSKGAFALATDGTLKPVGLPVPDYPLCSEYLLSESYRPRRVDSSFESAVCRVQTLLADRSALFTFLSNRISQNPEMLQFLYKLGSPSRGAETMTPRTEIGAASPTGGADADVAPRTELTVEILRSLAREVRSHGAELMLPVVPAYWSDFDPRSIVSEGVTFLEIEVDLDQRELHYEHDSHLNPRGHEIIARLLAPALAKRIRSGRRLAHVPRSG